MHHPGGQVPSRSHDDKVRYLTGWHHSDGVASPFQPLSHRDARPTPVQQY